MAGVTPTPSVPATYVFSFAAYLRKPSGIAEAPMVRSGRRHMVEARGGGVAAAGWWLTVGGGGSSGGGGEGDGFDGGTYSECTHQGCCRRVERTRKQHPVNFWFPYAHGRA